MQFLLGAFYLFFINTLFISLSSALVTALMKVPPHQSLDRKKQKRINRTVSIITIVTVVPSLIIGAHTVYSSYIDRTIEDYLKNEFVFNDTQLVQTNVDKGLRKIVVCLVGEPISDHVIATLEGELDTYGLGDFSLQVTQNSVLDWADADNTDKITIAVQENTIAQLQEQLLQQQSRLDELESSPLMQIDFEDTAKKAERIFPFLTNCRCGIIAEDGEEYFFLVATSKIEISETEQQVVENWLAEESRLLKAILFTR